MLIIYTVGWLIIYTDSLNFYIPHVQTTKHFKKLFLLNFQIWGVGELPLNLVILLNDNFRYVMTHETCKNFPFSLLITTSIITHKLFFIDF